MGFQLDFMVINKIFNGIFMEFTLINGIFNGIFNGILMENFPAWETFTVCELENGLSLI